MSDTTTPLFRCNSCGKSHDDLPLSFAADYPDMYANMAEAERPARAVISSDQCIIDEVRYFLRGCLEIPIIGSEEVFLWGLWAAIKEGPFNEISESWEESGREERHGPFKARLANSLTVYPDSLNAKVEIIIQPVGSRPLFILEEPDNHFAQTQRHGISRHTAFDLATALLHDLRV